MLPRRPRPGSWPSRHLGTLRVLPNPRPPRRPRGERGGAPGPRRRFVPGTRSAPRPVGGAVAPRRRPPPRSAPRSSRRSGPAAARGGFRARPWEAGTFLQLKLFLSLCLSVFFFLSPHRVCITFFIFFLAWKNQLAAKPQKLPGIPVQRWIWMKIYITPGTNLAQDVYEIFLKCSLFTNQVIHLCETLKTFRRSVGSY